MNDNDKVHIPGNPTLACDCSFYWIIKDYNILSVFDQPEGYSYRRPRCYDGTLLADLDIEIFEDLCPEQI